MATALVLAAAVPSPARSFVALISIAFSSVTGVPPRMVSPGRSIVVRCTCVQ
jgi:hypothetical protein